jgi:hypothetical protein
MSLLIIYPKQIQKELTMTTVITTMDCVLSVLAPLLFIYIFAKGIKNSTLSEESKSRLKKFIVSIVILWTAVIWVVSLSSNLLGYHEGDGIPRFTIALFIPVLIGLFALASQSFRTVLDSTPLSLMVGVQTFRLMGIVFLFVAAEGLGPKEFVSSGYGDLATGGLALIAGLMLHRNAGGAKFFAWLFTVVGLFDLLNVSRILLTYYPSWFDGDPSTVGAGAFPLVLVVAVVAPITLLLHIYSIRALLLKK